MKGEVVIAPASDNPGRFAAGARLHLGEKLIPVEVVESRSHRGAVIARLSGTFDRGAAEQLRGLPLFVDEAELPELDPDVWWEKDLIGMDVVDEDGTVLGELVAVVAGPMQDLWRVATPSGEVLVPAVEAIVRAVDIEKRRITLSPPAGLFE